MQKRTSAATSIGGKVNRIYKRLKEDLTPQGTTILDYGCGKYNDNKEFAEECGWDWSGYDPYNRSDEENRQALYKFDNEYPDIVICSNVLNVIDDEKELDNLLFGLSCDSSVTLHIFTIYEGDKSGVGKESQTDCWQRNEKVAEYFPKLRKHFKEVKKLKGETNIVICRN